MVKMPPTPYLEDVEGKKYVATGTRIGLDTIVWQYRWGKSEEGMLEAFPSIGSLENVRGLFAYIAEHPDAIEAYLRETEELWEKFKKEHPMPEDMVERLRRADKELSDRSA
jgi:uncharacterized protein (DUF433 family)